MTQNLCSVSATLFMFVVCSDLFQIGAGTALPGLVASLCGAHVTLTDKEEYPECLENCWRSCHVNGQDSVKVVGITWGQFTPNLFKLVKPDIILGSDCFYDTKGNITSLCNNGVKASYYLKVKGF